MFRNIFLAFIGGVAFGILCPGTTDNFDVASALFVRCIKMVVVPIIFFSLVAGMCKHSSENKGGVKRLFIKTLLYFEVMSLVSILITFGFMLLLRPGEGLDLSPFQNIDISHFKVKSESSSLKDFFFSVFPDSFFGTLTHDNLLTVIFLAVISSLAIMSMPKNKLIIMFVEEANRFFFQLIHLVVKFSPIAIFAAIAHTIGQSGLASLVSLSYLILTVLASMMVFCLALACVAQFIFKIPIVKLFIHIKQELLIAFATSSSETVFPQLLEKLESFGCSQKTTTFVLPMGYSFNLDGTAIYVTAGALFIQQAYHIPFTPMDYVQLFLILLVTSKGAAGVTGAGFVALSATLAAIPETPIPLAGLGILLGIDRFMSDARAMSNIIGNVIGTLIIAKSEKSFTLPKDLKNRAIEQE
ncbi:MAG: cation:dicarboxylase symporter family transporter [Oligoflexales bacterium]|nr:cation:dicarboxylase symporter family transporter [Oligoflexales bacterium]